jgi:hypothetical protein
VTAKENTVTDDDRAALRDELALLGCTAEEIEELVGMTDTRRNRAPGR